MNERLYSSGGAVNDYPGDYRYIVETSAALKHISGGRAGGNCRRLSISTGERGQAMVEMALVLPIFLVMVFGIIEMGRIWGAKQALTAAAREGARILVLPYGPKPPHSYDSEDAVRSAALDAVRDSMNGAGVPVIVGAAGTKIEAVKLTPGPDGIFYTADDKIDPYENVRRGDRVGIQITHPFETPAPVLLRMFDHGAAAPAQSDIKMGMTCYMDHE